MQVELIVSARWIADVENLRTLDHHSVVVNEGKIIDILPTSEVPSKYTVDEEHNVDLKSTHVLIPGLINMHCHSAMTLFRSIIDDVPLHTWLESYIWPAEQKLFLLNSFELESSKQWLK